MTVTETDASPVLAAVTDLPLADEPGAAGVAAPTAEPNDEPGEIELEVREFVESLTFVEGDPRRILCRIAVRLARRVDQTGAAPAAIRELRVLLAQVSEIPDAPAGPVDGTRARRAARRIGTILQAVS